MGSTHVFLNHGNIHRIRVVPQVGGEKSEEVIVLPDNTCCQRKSESKQQKRGQGINNWKSSQMQVGINLAYGTRRGVNGKSYLYNVP